MKFLRLLILATLPFGTVPAATIELAGRIEGRLEGSIFDEVNYHTLDFYWFRVPEATTVNFNFCVTNGPGGAWGTGLSLRIYPNADAPADLSSIGGFSGANGFCTGGIYALSVGDYIFSITPGDTGYDGADGLVPFSSSGKDFFWFDYQSTITGNLELYETWTGQPDKTFLITSVPEPGLFSLLFSGSVALLALRRRRVLSVPLQCWKLNVRRSMFFPLPGG